MNIGVLVSFWIMVFKGGWSKKILLRFMSEHSLPMFSSKSFIVSSLIFRCLIPFKFIFVYGVKECFFFLIWILFYFIFLYSRFLLVLYFIQISVCMSVPISQFIPPPPLSPLGVHTFVLYICVSTSALQTGSSVLFF